MPFKGRSMPFRERPSIFPSPTTTSLNITWYGFQIRVIRTSHNFVLHVWSPAGLGYCIPQELQAHSQSCKATADTSQPCHRTELCFHTVHQHWRKLGDELSGSEMPGSQHGKGNSSLSAAKALYRDQMNSIQHTGGARKLEADGAGQDLCIGIR